MNYYKIVIIYSFEYYIGLLKGIVCKGGKYIIIRGGYLSFFIMMMKSENMGIYIFFIVYNIVLEYRINFIIKVIIDVLCSVDMWIKEFLFIFLYDNSIFIISGGIGCIFVIVVFGSKCYYVN